MSIINMGIGPSTDIVVFEANNAAEMQLLLRNWIADNGTLFLWDARLEGGGAAPRFACTLVVGGSEGGGGAIISDVSTLQAYARGGMNPIPPNTLSEEILADINGDSFLVAALLATGGVGPHWMQVAITAP